MSWACLSCTYTNSTARTMCEMCGMDKPSQAPPTQQPQRPQPAPAPAPAPAPSGPSEGDIAVLTDMSFSREQAIKALSATTNLDRALEWLIEHNMDSAPSPSPSPSPPVSSSASPSPPASASPPVSASPSRTRTTTATPKSKKGKKKTKSSPAQQQAEKKEAIERAKLREALAKQSQTPTNAMGASKEEKEMELKKSLEKVQYLKQEAERQRKLKEIQKEKEIEEAERAEEEERRQKRALEEQGLKDIPSALDRIKTDYGVARYKLTCSTVAKILKNVIGNPEDIRFRSLALNNEKIQKAVVRPVGGMVMMRILGFQEQDGRLVNEKPDLALLKQSLTHFKTESSSLETCIPQKYREMDENIPAELKYFATLELRNLFGNVIAAQGELNFLTIDTSGATYKRRLKKIPQLLEALKLFGYEPISDGAFLRVHSPDIPLFEAGVLDLNKQIQILGPLTPLRLTCMLLAEKNKGKVAKEVIERVQECVQRIIDNPLESKFRRVNLNKFYKKYPVPVKGGALLFKLFGFQVDKEEGIATAEKLDFSLAKLRLQDCKRGWAEAFNEMRRRRATERMDQGGDSTDNGSNAMDLTN